MLRGLSTESTLTYMIFTSPPPPPLIINQALALSMANFPLTRSGCLISWTSIRPHSRRLRIPHPLELALWMAIRRSSSFLSPLKSVTHSPKQSTRVKNPVIKHTDRRTFRLSSARCTATVIKSTATTLSGKNASSRASQTQPSTHTYTQ